MNKKTIRIGTRGSALALWQAETVKALLEAACSDYVYELKITHTKGDKILDVPLAKIGDKGLFTKELEVELFAGDVDMAVHSFKDMPTVLPEGARIGAVITRGEFRDALVSANGKTLETLDETDVIATSSLRRRAQLLHMNPKLNIVDIRGNVNTRLKKMDEGYCNVMVMAAAGLIRLGLGDRISQILDEKRFIPAAAQGVVSIEIRDNDPEVAALVAKIHDETAWRMAQAERTFLHQLEGGCQVPIGANAAVDGNDMTLTGFIASLDGSKLLRGAVSGPQPLLLGTSLADYLISVGGRDVLAGIR